MEEAAVLQVAVAVVWNLEAERVLPVREVSAQNLGHQAQLIPRPPEALGLKNQNVGVQ